MLKHILQAMHGFDTAVNLQPKYKNEDKKNTGLYKKKCWCMVSFPLNLDVADIFPEISFFIFIIAKQSQASKPGLAIQFRKKTRG